MHTSFLQFGRLHLPVFGVFAAAGVMAALALSQRTARYAGLSGDAVWNAGTTAVVAVFVISRLLLVVFNWKSFLEYPLLLLAVPSLTTLGVLGTCLFMLGYLRQCGIASRPLLDAIAPSAAVLWAFLSMARFADGTRDGMPASFFMGHGGVYPVELYTFFAAVATCFVLLRLLRQQLTTGGVAGSGFVCAGLAIYFIDFFRVPSDVLAEAWIDPSQTAALLMILVGVGLALPRKSNASRVEMEEAQRTEDHHAV